MNWQPIETAPRDIYTPFIAGFSPDEEGFSPPSREMVWSEASQSFRLTSDPSWELAPQPTHWMPLPEPPEGA